MQTSRSTCGTVLKATVVAALLGGTVALGVGGGLAQADPAPIHASGHILSTFKWSDDYRDDPVDAPDGHHTNIDTLGGAFDGEYDPDTGRLTGDLEFAEDRYDFVPGWGDEDDPTFIDASIHVDDLDGDLDGEPACNGGFPRGVARNMTRSATAGGTVSLAFEVFPVLPGAENGDDETTTTTEPDGSEDETTTTTAPGETGGNGGATPIPGRPSYTG